MCSNATSNDRVVEMCGSPFHRGLMYGKAHTNKIKQYFYSKSHEFSHLTAEWEKMARTQQAAMKQHCPVAFEETKPPF